MPIRKKKENGVTGSMLLISVSIIALLLLLILPNIYLDNHIYYESREIAHYQRVKVTLEEEQNIIKTKLDEVYYQENLHKQEIK